MSVKTTLLREPQHREFLLAQRRDPVTHKVFAAGDRVTRCSACLLPFLEHSWEAIGQMHCDQTASVALDDTETEAPVSNKPLGKSGPAARLPLQLAPIPVSLRKVPVTLN